MIDMVKKLVGRVLKYGDNINTDLIAPSPYGPCSREVKIAHAMDGVDLEFSKKVRQGDILVVGKNFGCGSSRETAPYVLKESGISVVIAESFARIFFRNAINIGLPLLTTSDIPRINPGDILEVEPINGIIYNQTTAETYQSTRLPENLVELLQDGGLVEHLKKKNKRKEDE